MTQNILDFPKSPNPKVSIILMLCNQAELTLECLTSILDYTDLPYELVIVDNGSDDETSLLLERTKHAAIHRIKNTAGLAKACNQGASLAQGEWLLFLNSGVQLMPEALAGLLRTGEGIQDCGAVGAKLLSPDGTVQEAGNIVWNDGSCSSCGSGDGPDKPQYGYLREVHYCSGACLMVKRDVLLKSGMFDEQYSSDYYDADLCMKIRELGYKVIFQPMASAIYSSEPSPDDQSMELGREKFRDKWRHLLKMFHAPEGRHEYRARHYPRGKYHLLMVDDRIPDPKLGSGFPRAYAILNCLSELDFQVTFFPLTYPKQIEPYTRILQQKGIEVLYSPELMDFPRFFEERKHVYDAVWISRPHNMPGAVQAIRSSNANQKIIYDAEGLFSVREILQLELLGYSVTQEVKDALVEEEVAQIMGPADVITTVSESERQTILKYIKKPVIVLGHTVEPRVTQTRFEQRHDLLFVGGFLSRHAPNEDSVHYFANEIYPRLYDELGAKFWIVGTNHLESVWRLSSDHIIVTGRVEQLWNYYNSCRVFVAPTRYEAGIPLKMLECLSHGLPAVVTPLIAEQLQLDEKTVLIGHDAEDYANKVIRCYTDAKLWNQLRNNSINYIRKECNLMAYKEKLRMLKQMITS